MLPVSMAAPAAAPNPITRSVFVKSSVCAPSTACRRSSCALCTSESDYAVRLREKQRLRAQYGVSEKQLRAVYEKGTHTAGQTGNAMLTDLETRLDALVLRAGIARTTAQARQFVVVPASPAPPRRPVSSWCTATSSWTATSSTARPTA